MTEAFGKNIRPDSFSGMIFGLEGIRGGAVFLNGPTGCKFYHSATVDGTMLSSESFDPLTYPEDYYFGQGRVPCTYLDAHDYVYGSEEKLSGLLTAGRKYGYDFVALVNSPGAALIGDDLAGILEKYPPAPVAFSLESPGFSGPYGQGLQRGLIALLEALPMEGKEKKGINLLGLHLFQKHGAGNLKELKRLFALGGVPVNTGFFRCGIEELKEGAGAALNVVVSPENGLELARYLEKRFGTPYVVPKSGQPLGFQGTEDFFREVSEHISMDLSAIEEELNRTRARAYLFLARISSLLGKPKGTTYSLRGDASLALPALKFFTEYLGMIPLEVILEGEDNDEFRQRAEEFLRPFCPLGPSPFPVYPQMVAGDGNDVAQGVPEKNYLFGLELSEPSMGYLDVVEKTLYGGKGALYLLEQILNGVRFS